MHRTAPTTEHDPALNVSGAEDTVTQWMMILDPGILGVPTVVNRKQGFGAQWCLAPAQAFFPCLSFTPWSTTATITVELSISPLTSLDFCFMYFGALFLGAYMFIMVRSS